MRINCCLVVLALAAFCPIVRSQESNLWLSDLKSSDWQTRSAAYAKIAKDADALKRSEVRAALLDLLGREERVLRKDTSDSNSYAESYGEYVSYLADTAAQVTDWSNQGQVCILAHGPYDPLSRFASDLAVKGGPAVIPCLLKMSEGNFGDRYQSIPVLVHSAAISGNLPPETRQQVRRIIISGMRDSNVLIRQATIEAVGAYGNEDMVPVLKQLAISDPVSRRLDNGQLYFTVRESAKGAIQSIQDRVEGQSH